MRACATFAITEPGITNEQMTIEQMNYLDKSIFPLIAFKFVSAIFA
ncbi:hypothetical protein BCL90_2271 [Pedobacter alluvionis]|uniref:Uncharacterized protein n=1 Tax=Pedobacter alluvionis TaxID=475253 RepID=A0A497Y5Y1_9SPHI|nr:hypothetical protein BCL90_2271 [Pedobacter alluvionis]